MTRPMSNNTINTFLLGAVTLLSNGAQAGFIVTPREPTPAQPCHVVAQPVGSTNKGASPLVAQEGFSLPEAAQKAAALNQDGINVNQATRGQGGWTAFYQCPAL